LAELAFKEDQRIARADVDLVHLAYEDGVVSRYGFGYDVTVHMSQ
jgi:hypothetical protein